MKNIILLALLLAGLSVSAQRNYPKGTYLVGFDGTGSYRYSNIIVSQESYSYSIAPYFGYFVAKNLATGLLLSFGQMESIRNGQPMIVNTFSLNNSVNALSTAAFARYYVKNWKVKPYLEVGTGVDVLRGEAENITYLNDNFQDFELHTENVKSTNFLATGAIGLLIPLGKKLSIDLVFRDKFTNRKQHYNSNYTGSLRLGASFRF